MSIEVDPGSVLRFAQLRPGRWRNGAGTTREIASGGGGAEGFDWRLSLAEIECPGAFSCFPGTRRILTVVQGAGIILTLEGRDHCVEPGVPFHFAGDVPVTARLPAGPVCALNVVTRVGAVRAEVSVLELSDGECHDLPADRFAVVLSGRLVLLRGAGATPLRLHDTVRGAGRGSALTGSGVLAAVRFTFDQGADGLRNGS